MITPKMAHCYFSSAFSNDILILTFFFLPTELAKTWEALDKFVRHVSWDKCSVLRIFCLGLSIKLLFLAIVAKIFELLLSPFLSKIHNFLDN